MSHHLGLLQLTQNIHAFPQAKAEQKARGKIPKNLLLKRSPEIIGNSSVRRAPLFHFLPILSTLSDPFR